MNAVMFGIECVRVRHGVRSAVFAPFENLGLVLIDEEHEGSYKQEERPNYHARDVALARCKQIGAPLVLGSATPDLCTYYKATITWYYIVASIIAAFIVYLVATGGWEKVKEIWDRTKYKDSEGE